jgi:hypothetical protein
MTADQKEEVLRFSRSILSVLALLQTALEKQKAVAEAVELPQDWPATQAILRGVAEDLMIAASVDEATRLLKRDLKAALTAVLVARKLTPVTARKLIRLAHAKAPPESATLPCQPLALFLIKICESLELSKPQ